jgi:hypothetical protein
MERMGAGYAQLIRQFGREKIMVELFGGIRSSWTARPRLAIFPSWDRFV